MSELTDFATAKNSEKMSEAIAGFERLVRANKLSKVQAEELRKVAACSAVRVQASKFLGKWTEGVHTLIGWGVALLLGCALIYGIMHLVANQSREEQRRHAAATRAKENKTKSALDMLVAEMKQARKVGLTDGRILLEESEPAEHSLKLFMAETEANTNGFRYFGTIQLSRTTFNGKPNEIYYIVSNGCDPKKSESLTLTICGGESLLSLTPVGYSMGKGGVITEYYGAWCMSRQADIKGNFLAKQAPTSLQIQMFSTKDGRMLYDGRVLMKAAK